MRGVFRRFELTAAFAGALAACSGDHDTGDRSPTDMPPPVDCSSLCPAPKRLVDEATQSDGVRLVSELDSGDAQVLLGWSEGGSAAQWFLPAPTADAGISFGAGFDNLPVWNLRIALPCFPESAVNIQWSREGEPTPLTQGSYPLLSLAFDVPEWDQGTDLGSMKGVGDVVITGTADDLVSGYLHGSGGGDIESYATQEDLGLHYEVAAMQFEQIHGDFVASP